METQPQEFRPTVSQGEIEGYIAVYKRQPGLFDDDKIKEIEKHAQYYGVDFSRDMNDEEIRLGRIANQALEGYLSGLTTLNFGSEPVNVPERISRSIGGLLGFVGASPIKGLKGFSVPMLFGKQAVKTGRKIGSKLLGRASASEAGAVKSAVRFLQKDATQNIAEGALSLGAAQAISSWQEGIDGMMRGMIYGGVYGSLFRVIGNVFKAGGPRMKVLGSKAPRTQQQKVDLALRAVSGSLLTGLPSTYRGDTTPEQIYEYLLGAWFGAHEAPAIEHRANRLLLESAIESKAAGRDIVTGLRESEAYKKAPGNVRSVVDQMITERFGTTEQSSEVIRRAVETAFGEEYAQNIERVFKAEQEAADEQVQKVAEEPQIEKPIVDTTIQAERAEEHISREKSKEVITRVNEIENAGDGDTGEPILEREIGKKYTNWVERNIPIENTLEGRKEKFELAKYIEESFKSKIKPESYSLDGFSEFVESLQSDKKMTLSPEQKNEIKGWFLRANSSKQVQMISVTDRGVEFLSKNNPVNRMQNSKLKLEPVKRAEVAFDEAFRSANNGRKYGGKDAVYVLSDHIIIDTPNQRMELSWADFYEYTQSFANKEYVKEINRYVNRYDFDSKINSVLADMAKRGYVYLGGKGDSFTLNFVKEHPYLTKAKQSPKELSALRKKVIKAFGTEFFEYSSRWPKSIRAEKENNFISNVLYDLSMNGFRVNKSLTIKKIRDVVGNGAGNWIKNAVGFNKRMQIWMTNGVPLNNAELAKEIPDAIDGKLNVQIFESKGDKYSGFRHNDTAASDFSEAYDGSLVVRDDVVDAINNLSGLPKSGQNKPFIISPDSELGALLGKQMIHKAGIEQSAEMRKKGQHILMPTTSAKQYGLRELGETYQIEASDIKVVLSEKSDPHMLEPQKWPKQMYSNLMEASFSRVDPEVIKDMFEELSGSRFRGSEEANKAIEALADDPANPKAIKKALNAVKDAGLLELFDAIKKPGNEKFAIEAYKHILRIQNDEIRMMAEEGEITAEEALMMRDEVASFTSAIDRIMRVADGPEVVNHKMVKNYMDQSLRNFVVNSVTRPRLPNSISARTRPYTDYLQKKFPELEHNREIFYLDESFRDTNVDLEFARKHNPEMAKFLPKSKLIKLGELWENYKDVPELESFWNSINLRVPMDSMSGAHVLRFKGFTGIDGHGVLAHPTVLRALGGADLDGDKFFVFFGLKKSWRDAYKNNEREFYRYRHKKTGKELSPEEYDALPDNKKTNYLEYSSDNKDMPIPEEWQRILDTKAKTLRELLAVTPDRKESRFMNSKFAKYDPDFRMKISTNAALGRKQLGPSVVTRQILNSYYSALMATEGQVESFRANVGKGTIAEITVKPRADLQFARELGRATIALPSDPLDEIGLASREVFFNSMHKAMFETEVKLYSVGKGNRLTEVKNKSLNDKKLYRALRSGMFKSLHSANSALYGKNWSANRKFTYGEIKELLRGMTDLSGEQKNTPLPMIADKVMRVNWSDNMFARYKTEELFRIYKEYADNLGKYKLLLKPLGRTTLSVSFNPILARVHNAKLYDHFELKKVAESEAATRRIVEKTPYSKEPMDTYQARVALLEKVTEHANRFLTDDISDMVTVRLIKKIAEKGKILSKRISKISKDISEIKDYYAKEFSKRRKFEEPSSLSEDLTPELMTSLSGRASGERNNSSALMLDIDSKIAEYKKTVLTSNAERVLFDIMMLGTLRRPNEARLKELQNIPEKDRTRRDVEQIEAELDKRQETSLMRLGYNSASISDRSVELFMREYAKTLRSGKDMEREAKELESVEARAEEVTKDTGTIISEGREIKAGIFEDPKATVDVLKDIMQKRDVEFTEDMSTELNRLKVNLIHYKGSIGNDLNEIARGLVGKDLNGMNLEDIRVLNNMFEWYRTPSFFTKIEEFLSGKKETGVLPAIKKRFHRLFPEAVNRYLMREGLEVNKAEGVYRKKTGELVMGKIARPTHYVQHTSDLLSFVNQHEQETTEKMKNKFHDRLSFLDGVPDAQKTFHVAVAQMEKLFGDTIASSNKSGLTEQEIRLIGDLYTKQLDRALETTNWAELKKKSYVLSGGKRVSADGIVRRIKKAMIETNEEMREFIQGDPKALDKYIVGYWDTAKTIPRINMRKFIGDLSEARRSNKKIPLNFGHAGMLKVQMSFQLEEAPDALFKKIIARGAPSIGIIDADKYFPHMNFSQKEIVKWRREKIEKIRDNPDMTNGEKARAIASIYMRTKSETGEWIDYNAEEWANFDLAKEEISRRVQNGDGVRWLNTTPRAGNTMSRLFHVDGWTQDISSYEMYMGNLVGVYHRQIGQIMSRYLIRQFESKYESKAPGNLVKAWSNWIKLYVNDSLGYPVVIPDYMYYNKDMNLRGTMYAGLADNRVAKKLDNIAKKLGLTSKDLPEGVLTIDPARLRRWSNNEAKFELMSLLAHPKSSMANLYGGHLHTLVSTGFDHFRKANNINYLRSVINKEWKSMDDVRKWAIEKGIMPEFLAGEFGLSKKAKPENFRRFASSWVDKMSRGELSTNKSVTELAKQHGVLDAIVESGAMFMRIPEMNLRIRSFMAHYIQAYEGYGAGLSDPLNHPFLLEMAKKGVKATQFLYDAPNRPAFARSALGKVMTRFQLWAWNSVRFRNNVIKDAKLYNYNQSSMEYNRLKRLALTDAFALTLAYTFQYSLFEASLPAPWSWFQDTADWLFGDDKERDRAFFGAWPTSVAPLQMVTPPFMRMAPAIFKGLTTRSWDKLASYTIWTMFPFGRIARDIFGPQNIIENPIRTIEKMTGLPYLEFHRYMKKHYTPSEKE